MKFVSSSDEHRVSAHHTRECSHCDTAPPNPHTHRRVLVVFAVVFAAVGALAAGDAMVQGVADMGTAFPNAAALLDGTSWDRFFAAFGKVTLIVLAAAAALWIVRRRRRKQKTPAAAKH